ARQYDTATAQFLPSWGVRDSAIPRLADTNEDSRAWHVMCSCDMTAPKSILGSTVAASATGAALFYPRLGQSFPALLPGHDPSLAKVHLVSFLVGLVLLGYARYQRRRE